MLETKRLEFSDFSSLVGSSFHIHNSSSHSLPLELLEAKKIGNSSAQQNTQIDSFSLLLRGPRDSVLPQQIYSFTHSQLGELSLFLVPVGQDSDGIRYEVIFN